MIVPLKQPIMYSIWRKTVSLQFPPLMQMSHFIMSYLISVLLLQTIASRYIQQLNNFHHKYHHLFPPPPQKKKILLRIIDLDNIFRVINRHYSEYTYIQDTLFPHPDNITRTGLARFCTVVFHVELVLFYVLSNSFYRKCTTPCGEQQHERLCTKAAQ